MGWEQNLCGPQRRAWGEGGAESVWSAAAGLCVCGWGKEGGINVFRNLQVAEHDPDENNR